MFNIGGGEVLVIALIALIVLGPQRLPDAAKQVGKAMGELRRLSSGFQNELRDALNDTEVPAPRRDVLAAPAAQDTTPPAVAAVSSQAKAPARRTPLRAAPVEEEAPPAKRSPAKRADPVSKAPRPRSKGS